MKKTNFFVIACLFLFSIIKVNAQIFPIRVSTLLHSPYTPFLSSYGSEYSSNLSIQIIANDASLENYPVRLQFFLEGMSGQVIMYSKEISSIDPMYISNGEILQLDGMDVYTLFQANNLIFTGIDQNSYILNNRIPDGLYRIGFRLIDATRTNVALSNVGYTSFCDFSILNPPALVFPSNQSVFDITTNNILFQWNSMNVGKAVARKLLIYELDQFMNPSLYESFVISNEDDATYVFEDNLGQSSYTFNISGSLTLGTTYAWRVKEYSADGSLLFNNNGYSPIRYFSYGTNCLAPTGIVHHTEVRNSANIQWNSDPVSNTAFKLRIRDESLSSWSEMQVLSDSIYIGNLISPSKTYEYQLQSQCGGVVWSDYSPVQEFTMADPEPTDFICGKIDSVWSPQNTNPLEKNLKVGDTIDCGKYKIGINSLRVNNGRYSGEGSVRLPFLADLKFQVELDDIQVNSMYEIYDGKIISKLDPDALLVFTLGGSDYVMNEDIGISSGLAGFSTELSFSLNENETPSVTWGSNNTLTIHTSHGDQSIVIQDEVRQATFTDAAGRIFAVEGDNSVRQIGTVPQSETSEMQYNAAVSHLNDLDDDIIVEFTNSDDWAFDTYKNYYDKNEFGEEYQKINGRFIANKMIPVGKIGKVIATITKGTLDINKLIFKTPAGTIYTPVIVNGKAEITISGGEANDGQELFAVYQKTETKEVSVGKINIFSYDMQSYKVSLINTTNSSINTNTLATNINSLYSKYGIEYNLESVDFKDNTWDTQSPGILSITGTKCMSRNSTEMQALIDAFKAKRPVNEETLYLFVVNQTDSATGIFSGDMPVGEQFGFLVSSDLSSSNTSRTVAHQIGHGIFKLIHTFDDFYAITKGSTDNLMDYTAEGKNLAKRQWDEMFDPAVKQNLFKKSLNQDLVTETPTLDGTLQLIIKQDIKAGEMVKIGPLEITFTEAPVKDPSSTVNENKFTSNSCIVKLGMKDPDFQSLVEYRLYDAKINYSTAPSDNKLISASITYTGLGEFTYLGTIGGKATNASLQLDNNGKLSGNIDFTAILENEAGIDNFIFIQPDIQGNLKFSYNTNTTDIFKGSVDYSGITAMSISIRKGNGLIVSQGGLKPTANGDLTTNFQGDIVVSYSAANANYHISSIDFAYEIYLKKASFKVNNFTAKLDVQNVDGFIGTVHLDLKYNGTSIEAVASSANTGQMAVYGFTFDKQFIKAKFSKILELEEFKADGFTGKYDGIYEGETVTGEITNAIAISTAGTFTSLDGKASIETQKYGKYLLDNSTYNSNDQKAIFEAAKDADNTTTSKVIVNVLFCESGAIELTSVSSDQIFSFGPVQILFDNKYDRNTSGKTKSATVKFKIEDGEYSKAVEFAADVFYKSDGGIINFVDINKSDLTLPFGKIYAFDAQLKSITLKYSSSSTEVSTNLILNTFCTLSADVPVRDFLIVGSEASGIVTFTSTEKFNQGTSIKGILNYSQLQNYNLKLKIGEEIIYSVPINTASTEETTVSYKKLKIDFSPGGLFSLVDFADKASVCVDAFSFKYLFHIGKCKAEIPEGFISVAFYGIPGIADKPATEESSPYALGVKYQFDRETITAGVFVSDVNLFCGFKIAQLDAKITFENQTFKIKKISIDAKVINESFTGPNSVAAAGKDCEGYDKDDPACISNMIDMKLLWEDMEFKKIEIVSDISYKGFLFRISNFVFEANVGFKASAEMKYGDSFLSVTNLEIKTDGTFTFEKAAGHLDKSPLLLDVEASLTGDQFAGTFTAEFGSMFGLNGTLILGSAKKANNEAYNYGYCNLAVKTQLAFLGPIKLKRIGGAFGWNASISYVNGVANATPMYGVYAVGLDLMIGDALGAFEVGINPLLANFGNNYFAFTANGIANIPAKDPWITAGLSVNYEWPTHNFSASVFTNILMPAAELDLYIKKIPAGGILDGKINLAITRTKALHRAVGVLDVSILKSFPLNFTLKGNLDSQQNFDPTTGALLSEASSVSGSLAGGINLKADFFLFKTIFNLGIGASVSAVCDSKGIKDFSCGGNFNIDAKITGSDESDVLAGFAASMNGKVDYIRDVNRLNLSGKTNVSVTIIGISYSTEFPVNETYTM